MLFQVCASNNGKCIVIRSLSDLAGGDAGADQIDTYFNLAAANGATMLVAMVTAA